MTPLLLKLIEAIGLRAAPGMVNLAALLLMGSWLSTDDYGIYSTIIAAAGFLSNMIYGPLMFAVVSQHAKLCAAGLVQKYESSFVTCVFLVSAAVAGGGTLLAALDLVRWSWILPVVSLGAYSALQEILHARLRLWTFGAVALLQAVTFMLFAWLLVRPQPNIEIALAAFSLSYAVAGLTSLLASGIGRLGWPDFRLIGGTAAVGGAYTIGTVAEQAFYLGIRYLVFSVDTRQSLGTFSFCVDLAQRLMGFLVSAIGFVAVPAAFKADAENRREEFSRQLYLSAAVALALSLLSLVAVLLVRHLGLVPSLSGSLFDPQVFVIVSIAVVLNRLKKIVLDPIAMRAGRAAAIAIGYSVGAPAALAIGALAFGQFGGRVAELTYLLGCVLTILITAFVIKRVIEQR